MKIKDIIIEKRVRKDIGDLTLLKESIEKHGLLYPIIVDSRNRLIAGERRLTAIKELGWEEVDVIIKDISLKEALNIELTENITRKDFVHDELIFGLKKKKEFASKNIFTKLKLFFIEFIYKIFKK